MSKQSKRPKPERPDDAEDLKVKTGWLLKTYAFCPPLDKVVDMYLARAGDCLILSAQREAEIQKNGEQTKVTPRNLIIVNSNNVIGAHHAFTDQARHPAPRARPLAQGSLPKVVPSSPKP